MEELELKDFDTIVLGTGLSESILASATAYNGKPVLHLDERDHYGGFWSTFQLHSLLSFLKHQESKGSDPKINPFHSISFDFNIISIESILSFTNQEFSPVVFEEEDLKVLDNYEVESDSVKIRSVFLKVLKNNIAKNLNSSEYSSLIDEMANYVTNHTFKSFKIQESNISFKRIMETVITKAAFILTNSRTYNFELVMKKVLANGPLVSLFLNSGISKYIEFKLLNQTQLFWEGSFKKIPCSKEDVFVNESLSLINKRKLMKFLLFAMDYNNQSEIWQDKKNNSFASLLKEDFKLTEELVAAVVHCIALSYESLESITTEIGLKAVQNFTKSLGKFGNHSLLWTIYGAGSEISQAFCRVCAIYNGIYILNHPIENIQLLDKRSQLNNVESHSDGYSFQIHDKELQVFRAKNLVLGIDYIPEKFQKDIYISGYIYKMIVVISGISLQAPNEVMLFNYPKNQLSNPSPIYSLVLSDATSACPSDQNLIYFWMYSSASDISFEPLFEKALSNFIEEFSSNESKPDILMKISYSQAIRAFETQDPIPDNFIICNDPTADILLDDIVPLVQSQFKNFAENDEEFFPHRFDSSSF